MSFADGGRPRHQIVRSHEVQELARSVRVAAERDADAGAAFRGARALLERMRRAGLRLVVASSTRAEELGQLLRIAGTDGLIKTTTSSRRRGPVEAVTHTSRGVDVIVWLSSTQRAPSRAAAPAARPAP